MNAAKSYIGLSNSCLIHWDEAVEFPWMNWAAENYMRRLAGWWRRAQWKTNR